MTDAAETAEWKFDADQHDPLTALRIPVTSFSPCWKYTATLDRESEARPTDLEAAQRRQEAIAEAIAEVVAAAKKWQFTAQAWNSPGYFIAGQKLNDAVDTLAALEAAATEPQ